LPTLRSLWLHLDPNAYGFNIHVGCAMPNVRLVDLKGVSLPWDTCTNLTTLSLQMLGEASPSVPQLLAIMMLSPALEYIQLVDMRLVIGTPIPQTPVELLHLRTLILGLESAHVLHILSCISIPSFAMIRIVSPTSSLASILPRDIKHLHNLTSDEESILRLDPFRLELRRSRPVDLGSQTILQVAISAMSDSTLASIVEIVEVSRIVTLEINGWQLERITDALFRTFLMALTCITTLKAEYAGSEFFELLTQPEESPPSSTLRATNIICPHLTSVVIEHLTNTDDTQLIPLVNWLKQRNQLGARLHRLELDNCDFSQRRMNESRALVDELIIRGVEETFPKKNSRFRRWAGRRGGLL
jgi:hypothetical protein